jgi:hypothetical protein
VRYRLILLTDGRGLLQDTLESFLAHVRPRPAQVYAHADGQAGFDELAQVIAATYTRVAPVWNVGGTTTQQGFCSAVAECWAQAALAGVDFIYWLEDDFLHERDVDLEDFAAALLDNPQLAQMALCRPPANVHERTAGGLVASRPGEFTDRGGWLEHRAYWTTNPSLFRRALADNFGWPLEPECEGLFGAALRATDHTFGLWGSGEPWVDHVGVRAGKGY